MNDQYLQYGLGDFLADDTFVNWAIEGTDDDKWQSWLTAHGDEAANIEHALKVIKQLRFIESDSEVLTAQKKVWQRISASTQAKEVNIIKPTRRRWLYGVAVAAVIATLAIVLLPDNDISINTDVAMTESLVLPANSNVTLSTSSSLSYNEKGWSKSRNVTLDGQAHFNVSKGVSFVVSTNNGSVKVLGTEFDVVSDDDAFQVKVTEGRVSVHSDNHERILTAGMAFYKNPKWEGKNGLNESWKTSQVFFAFRDRPLEEVLKAISFSYGASFDIDTIDTSVLYTGSFNTIEELSASLQSVLWPLGLRFEAIEEKFKLSRRE